MKNIPIVILHGWNLSSQKFTPLVDALSDIGFKVLCPDLPGFGKSSKPFKALTLDDYQAFVLDYLINNRVSQANFICHSFGGRIAIKLAVSHPEKINKLILSGVPGLPPVPKFRVIFFLILAKIGKIIFSLPFLSLFRNILQKILYKLAGASDFYHTDQSLKQTFQNVVSEKLTLYLSKITVPVYLIWGQKDSLVPISIAQQMNNLIPSSKLKIVPGVGHNLPFKQPIIFIKYLKEFL